MYADRPGIALGIRKASANSCAIYSISGSIFFHLKTDLFAATSYKTQDLLADRVDTWYPGYHFGFR